jgi:transcriptional regulator GlxA family with amidase domain
MSSAVVGLLDAFHIANRWIALSGAKDAALAPVVLGARAVVTGSAGFDLRSEPADRALAVDVAIVPPTLTPVEETVAANQWLVEWLGLYAEAGGVAASVCTGAFFLARAGLLVGRRATTNPAFGAALLRIEPGARLLLERRVVDDGRILTAGSTTAFLDLAVYLVDRFAGHAAAVATAQALSIDKNHRSQLPFFLPFAEREHGDAAVLALQEWLEERFAERVTAPHLARRAALSQRSLNRRFLSATGLTPMGYVHRVRVEAAKRLLETSKLHVQEITVRVGYSDARSFCRLFRDHAGVSPRAYRERFGVERSLSEGDTAEATRPDRRLSSRR